jgi:hypothetical protein
MVHSRWHLSIEIGCLSVKKNLMITEDTYYLFTVNVFVFIMSVHVALSWTTLVGSIWIERKIWYLYEENNTKKLK